MNREAYFSISAFRHAHQAILATISDIQPLLRAYLQAKPKILAWNKQLLDYFKLQDREFWDRLEVFYMENREASKMLEFLSVDLKDVKIKYLAFFEKHSGEMQDTKARSFPKDFTDFAGLITARIKVEEEYLFPLLKKAADDCN